MPNLKEFTIDEKYLGSGRFDIEFTTLTGNPIDDVSTILKNNEHTWKETPWINSQSFNHLRDELEENGYIECNRRLINCDEVIKSFKVNGYLFEVGDHFVCASALRILLENAKT